MSFSSQKTQTWSDEVASELRSFGQLKHAATGVFFRVPHRMSALTFLFCFHLQVSICLECNSSKLRGLKRKWIRCSAQATVLHLKKFIAKKLNLTSFNEVQTASPAGTFSCITPKSLLIYRSVASPNPRLLIPVSNYVDKI